MMMMMMMIIIIIIIITMLNGHYSIDLAEDRERWRAVINFTVNLQVSLNVANFLTG